MSKYAWIAFIKIAAAVVAGLVLTAGVSLAQTPAIPPQIGSQNTVTADPGVLHPQTTPCVVTLFADYEFANYSAQTFSYTPPANCPGPWAKIVFEANINVTEGIQYDRTGSIYLGHVNIYYGTTAEPAPTFGPSWHVERDLTDYASLFTAPQTGEVDLYNIVNSTYTGILFGTATVSFYPVPEGQRAPLTADAIYPMPDAEGGAAALNTGTDQLTGTFTLPTNVERAYLDLITQNQSDDEFWYTCVPNDVASELESCGNTAFREAEISVDGTPAGSRAGLSVGFYRRRRSVLRFPLPGVQTLDFVPYRVDLTPFAGVLSNGQPHTVAVSVFNADSYFLATGTLLVYLDHGATQVTGDVTENTIGAGPNPNVTENLTTNPDGSITGTVAVTSQREFVVGGFVNTSHGRVATQVFQSVNFSNSQQFVLSNTQFTQDITQSTKVNSTTVTRVGPIVLASVQQFNYPLVFNIGVNVNSDGSEDQAEDVHQTFETSTFSPGFIGFTSNHVDSADTLTFDSSGNFTGNVGQASDQTYTTVNSNGFIYDCTLKAASNALTSISRGCSK